MAESSPTSTELRQICRRILSKPPSMSSSSVSLTEELRCCVCLDVFSDPVSTPCGHNFCRICLKQCWDISQIYSCPYCKETFSKRPELKINTALREVTLIFKEKSSQVKSKKISRRRSEVLCDICEERKAQKSFLMCQTSYCETHLDLHEKMSLKKHKLLDPVENIKDYICEKHERPLELFCRDDQTCVCVFCTDGDHKNHNTVPLEEESKEKKTQLMKTQTDIQQMIQKRIKKIQDIKHSAELRKRSREQEKAASVELFSDLIRSIERCQTELLEMMEEEQKAEEKQDEDLIKNLKQEITELKWRDRELEKITHSEDHLHLIQIDPSSLYRAPDMKNWSEISMKTHVSVETLRRALTQLQETLNEKLTQTVMMKMQQYAVNVTLDPDTAHPKLVLSEDRKQVKHGDVKHKLPDNPERFNEYVYVLGKEGFTSGRFYFEIQVKDKTNWILGVARESINRKGRITLTPQDGFWTVALWNKMDYWACVDPDVPLCLKVKPQKVGVFVDYEEGLVCFYDVESRSHIYSFTAQTFSEKLFPFFSPSLNYEGKNSAPLIISPVHYNK
ncbi:E3 ubiquitin-protein ligase TRIM39-like isoform X2 [Misgurnus anguillicaudatus]|uniref:E3 ubiquitin-protein ligase TRIM39-like isoform X2 n=1 Tax=Misgurnus anguillicaudatus TaxID=75329 RepID=UPI003CCEFFF9